MANSSFKMLAIPIFLCGLLYHGVTHVEANHEECAGDYQQHILILVSLDGFKPDYLNRGITPTLQALLTQGISVPYMTSTYPTVTFPNHYTIATGLYPESHGIIANSFFDEIFSESFSSASGGDGKWFGGEPIWNTVEKNGMKSAAYFWFGSEAEIGGMRPSYYYTYNGSVPYEDRIKQVLDWLVMPLAERPSWICVYFDEPDNTAHEFGPDSPEVDIQIERVDNIMLSLVEGIANLNLTNCVNLIIVSDHGMAEGGAERVIHLEQYDPFLDDKTFIYFGANSRLNMREGFEDEQIPVMNSLACETENMRQFDQRSLPKRYHFSNNPRIEDIILGLQAGHAINFESDFQLQGEHGYDNKIVEMQSLFVASGPDFKERTVISPFQNIELYNLMCDLMNVEPASNNGTKGSLYHIMRNPPLYPTLPVGNIPEIAVFPDEDDIPGLLTTSGCSGDLSSPEDWIFTLDVGETLQAELNSLHIPFGPPLYTSSLSFNVTLLYHNDHITGFSQSLKLPIWTSFTFNSTPTGSQESLWSSDVRLTADDSPKCSDFDLFTNYSMYPLFRPESSEEQSLDRIPFMISNAMPITAELELRYRELMTELVPLWQELHGSPLNVIAGLVYDNDFDSLVDDFPNNGEISISVPSDVFVIVTKCRTGGSLRDCIVDELQVAAFIYRQSQTVSNCLDRERFAEEFSARVKDIELSTGLVFFSDLGYQDATNLALRSTIGIWPTSLDQLHGTGSSIMAPSINYLSTLITTLSFVYYAIKSL